MIMCARHMCPTLGKTSWADVVTVRKVVLWASHNNSWPLIIKIPTHTHKWRSVAVLFQQCCFKLMAACGNEATSSLLEKWLKQTHTRLSWSSVTMALDCSLRTCYSDLTSDVSYLLSTPVLVWSCVDKAHRIVSLTHFSPGLNLTQQDASLHYQFIRLFFLLL